MRRAARIDDNQNKIVNALRKVGAYVLITSQLKNAFDILVVYKGQYFIMELKDGDKPTHLQKLTPGEIRCKENVERAGGTYHIITSVREALKTIGIN